MVRQRIFTLDVLILHRPVAAPFAVAAQSAPALKSPERGGRWSSLSSSSAMELCVWTTNYTGRISLRPATSEEDLDFLRQTAKSISWLSFQSLEKCDNRIKPSSSNPHNEALNGWWSKLNTFLEVYVDFDTFTTSQSSVMHIIAATAPTHFPYSIRPHRLSSMMI